MYVNKKIAVTAFVLFFALGLKSQGRMELTLNDAMRYAVEHNRQLRGASFAVKEAESAYRAAIAQGLPQAEAVYDYQNFFGAEANLGPMTFVFNPTSNLNFRASQLLFSGSYIVGLQMSKLYREMAEVNFEKTDADIKAQVANSYYMLLISRRSKEIIQQNVQNMQEVLSRTNALVSVGILDQTDKDQISLQVSMLENAIRTADRQIELAANLLRLNLGIRGDTEIVLADNLLGIMMSADVERTMTTAFDVNANFDYRLMQLQKSMATKQLSMERVKFLPTAAGFFNYTEKIKKAELDFQPKSVIGLNVSIPLFSSGARYFNQAKAKYQLQAVENQLAMVSDQLQIQESQLRFNLRNAYEQYEVQKENIELARRVYNNVYLKYQQGVASSLDVSTANGNILQAENSYLMAIMQVLESKTALDRLLNKL